MKLTYILAGTIIAALTILTVITFIIRENYPYAVANCFMILAMIQAYRTFDLLVYQETGKRPAALREAGLAVLATSVVIILMNNGTVGYYMGSGTLVAGAMMVLAGLNPWKGREPGKSEKK